MYVAYFTYYVTCILSSLLATFLICLFAMCIIVMGVMHACMSYIVISIMHDLKVVIFLVPRDFCCFENYKSSAIWMEKLAKTNCHNIRTDLLC